MDVGTKFYGNQLTHFTKNPKCQPQGGAREEKCHWITKVSKINPLGTIS